MDEKYPYLPPERRPPSMDEKHIPSPPVRTHAEYQWDKAHGFNTGEKRPRPGLETVPRPSQPPARRATRRSRK